MGVQGGRSSTAALIALVSQECMARGHQPGQGGQKLERVIGRCQPGKGVIGLDRGVAEALIHEHKVSIQN